MIVLWILFALLVIASGFNSLPHTFRSVVNAPTMKKAIKPVLLLWVLTFLHLFCLILVGQQMWMLLKGLL